MRICFIADARSPIARGWIELFRDRHELVVLSTFPMDSAWEGVRVVDLQWMNWMFRPGARNQVEKTKWVYPMRFLKDVVLLPMKSRAMAKQVRRIVAEWKPDVVHALRIPAEGQIAALAQVHPLVISVWGNDFTLHARKSPLNRSMASDAVRAAQAIIADCEADIVRARDFGLSAEQIT